MVFEPKIIAFLCNWCSYAGADLAGTSRISYPTNIRVIRVLCSGRVDPAFIFKAFENGADGVLVSGCYPGECHYISGNLNAEKRVEKLKRLLDLLWLGSERLRLEWISASEGNKFAEVVRDFTEKLRKMGPIPLKTEGNKRKIPVNTKETYSKMIKKADVQYCLECGKCSSTCPVARLDEEFSPRRTIEGFQLGFEGKILSSKELWECIACYLCRERCPLDVRFPEFVRECRSLAPRETMKTLCTHGGAPLAVSRIMANQENKHNRLGWIPKDVEFSERGDLLYFVGCLPYFDVIFKEFELNSLRVAESALRILNKLGIKPAILGDERCCAHDLLWTGDVENFEKLARLNVANIQESGAKKIVTTCPECYRTLKVDYPKVIDGLDLEVLHISELLSNLINEGRLEFNTKLPKKVVYHDSCRLGRHMGVYEPPRKVLANIPGVELMEMERNREGAVCCGGNSWVACNQYSKAMQIDRLKEAKATGADLLISACPKCQIHWKCVMSEKLPIKPEEIEIETADLTVLVAQTMNLI